MNTRRKLRFADIPRFASAALVARLAPNVAKDAADLERQVSHGMALGLTETQAREVIGYWHKYSRTHLARADDSLIRESMTRRAIGEKWHP